MGTGNGHSIIVLSLVLLVGLMIPPAIADSPHPPPGGDFDGDGHANFQDACPHFSAPASGNGCSGPDSDNDGVPDKLEATSCVGQPEDYAGAGESGTPGIADGCPGTGPVCPDTFPTVATITASPATPVTVGTSITFTTTATDAEDGILTASISWTSSIDGGIGSGGSTAATLTVGTHTISASVTDSCGQTSNASISVTVNPVSNGDEKKSCAALEKENKAEEKGKAQGKAIAKDNNGCN